MDRRARITGIDHVTLAVTDLRIAEELYVDVLGGELVRLGDDIGVWFGSRPHLRFASAPVAAAQVSLTVRPDDLVPLRNALHARGIETSGPIPNGAPGHVALRFVDPFGNSLELTTTGFRGEVAPPSGAHPRPRRSSRVSSRRLIQ
jgi:catechol 2,3-dioxygenase-like lactoylglutathione lyase family enzyme